MSTILNALQKQTMNANYSLCKKPSNRYWKVALVFCLLIIMVLLASLIFIQLTASGHFVKKTANAEQAVVANPLFEKPQEAVSKPRLITKVFFQTKPLPSSLNMADSNQFVSTDFDDDEVEEEKTAVVVKAQEKEAKQDPEIDYSDVSQDLQKRFKEALLMNKEQGKAIMESEDSDGLDLHQMASDFQDKVPAINYQFHVYSSDPKKRWIRINGEDLMEGHFDSSGELQIVEIQANRTIFRLDGQSFSLQSLTNWNAL